MPLVSSFVSSAYRSSGEIDNTRPSGRSGIFAASTIVRSLKRSRRTDQYGRADDGRLTNHRPECVAVNGSDHGHRELLPDPADLLAEVGDPSVCHRSGVAPIAGSAGAFAAGHLTEDREVEPGAERLTVA